jgi:hypothetical protein
MSGLLVAPLTSEEGGAVLIPNRWELSGGSLECLPFGLERARVLFLFFLEVPEAHRAF